MRSTDRTLDSADPDCSERAFILSSRLTKPTGRQASGLAQRRKQDGEPGVVTCVDKANVFSAFVSSAAA
jgi:hypothetical protein